MILRIFYILSAISIISNPISLNKKYILVLHLFNTIKHKIHFHSTYSNSCTNYSILF